MASGDGIVETPAAGSELNVAPPAGRALDRRGAIRWPLRGVSVVLWPALVVAAAVAVAGAVSRVWVGAHWPTDVLTGFLIAAGWLSLVVSVRWISEPAFRR